MASSQLHNLTESEILKLPVCQQLAINDTLRTALEPQNQEFYPITTPRYVDVITYAACILFFQIFYLLIKKFAPTDMIRKEKYLVNYYNILVSLIHAGICSLLVILILSLNPNLLQHAFTKYNQLAKILSLITLGYFTFDFIDYAIRGAFKTEIDILLHHIIVLLGIGFMVYHNLYLGYLTIGLLVEINSIFLHIRKIYLWSSYKKDNFVFFAIVWLNFITIVIFRLIPLAYMYYILILQFPCLSVKERIVGVALTSGLFATVLVLLYRVFTIDNEILFKWPVDQGKDKSIDEQHENMIRNRPDGQNSPESNQEKESA